MKKSMQKKHIGLTAFFYIVAVSGVLLIVNACTHKAQTLAPVTPAAVTQPYLQGQEQSKVVTVLNMSPVSNLNSTKVIFRELQEPFTISDAGITSSLKEALAANTPVKITFNPWQGTISQVASATEAERMAITSRQIISSPGSSIMVDLDNANPDVINNPAGLGVINTTQTGELLTSVIPDMATAQLIFDYLEHQSCELPGPYGVDYCITYQYCEDGCYARAHKMCYVINNLYHYATHKVFSFAYHDGPYSLCVKAQKWGGCCINWWYHVAPLVNIKTPSGTQAYVIDPAMFDQPVPLYTWLHMQQNPACADGNTPKVTSYNIQPTSSYDPYDTSSFGTDPLYANTDTTLVHYHSLVSCP